MERSGRIGQLGYTSRDRMLTLVTGVKGENVIEARGATQAEAWHRALAWRETLPVGPAVSPPTSGAFGQRKNLRFQERPERLISGLIRR
jgi:hypothetical protein